MLLGVGGVGIDVAGLKGGIAHIWRGGVEMRVRCWLQGYLGGYDVGGLGGVEEIERRMIERQKWRYRFKASYSYDCSEPVNVVWSRHTLGGRSTPTINHALLH